MTRSYILPTLLLLTFSLLIGCTTAPEPTPDYTAIDIQNYFTPQNSSPRYLWEHIDYPKNTDSLYYFQYNGGSAEFTADGYSPTLMFSYSDTARKNSDFVQFHVSDKRAISYGSSAKNLATRLLLLSDTLRRGRKWTVADSFQFSNGAKSRIAAFVDDYFTSMIAGGKEYADVYKISYTTDSLLVGVPSLPEYQLGGKIVRYFVRSVGMVLEVAYSIDDILVGSPGTELEFAL